MITSHPSEEIAMPDHESPNTPTSKHTPWNKGKLAGAKPPLRPKHVWSIRTKLQLEGRMRDLAMFNLAIDSKLRGCDVVALKVEDIAPNGYTLERATIRRKKTGHPVRFGLVQDVDDPDAGSTISLWATEQALRNYESSDLLKSAITAKLAHFFSGQYETRICRVRFAAGTPAPDEWVAEIDL
jgi:hypothetical protein